MTVLKFFLKQSSQPANFQRRKEIEKNNNVRPCLHVLIPQTEQALRLRFAVSLLAEASNERSFPSSAPSIKHLLPLQSFTRRLISVKSMPLLVPAPRLQTPKCLLGAARISALFLFFPLLLYAPLFKSSQASASLSRLLLSPFKSRQVGANSLAVFLSYSFFLFFVRLLSPSCFVSASACISKLSEEIFLMYHCEGRTPALVYFGV